MSKMLRILLVVFAAAVGLIIYAAMAAPMERRLVAENEG
jgi:phage shock protein PspC (stress-responsive transcriptional regulator)